MDEWLQWLLESCNETLQISPPQVKRKRDIRACHKVDAILKNKAIN